MMDRVSDEDGSIIVDFVGRSERIAEDWRKACELAGIPYSPLPHLNKSQRRDYRSYYDEETEALIAKRFHRSIDTFGYCF